MAPQIIFDQGEFARVTSQYLTTCGGGIAWGLAEIGKVMRNKVGTETPRMDYLVGQLFFEEFVEDQRLVEDGMREARERFEFGLFGLFGSVWHFYQGCQEAHLTQPLMAQN